MRFPDFQENISILIPGNFKGNRVENSLCSKLAALEGDFVGFHFYLKVYLFISPVLVGLPVSSRFLKFEKSDIIFLAHCQNAVSFVVSPVLRAIHAPDRAPLGGHFIPSIIVTSWSKVAEVDIFRFHIFGLVGGYSPWFNLLQIFRIARDFFYFFLRESEGR